MKRTSYLILLAAALIATSCSKENNLVLDPAASNPEIGMEHDGKVTFMLTPDFGDNQEAGTRAMAEKPQVKNLYIAVFDAAGYKLAEYAKATSYVAATENDTEYKYSVELTVSDKPRIIHILANAPESLSFGSEAEIIGSLYSKYNADETSEWQDAYWQRIELPGIYSKPASDDPDYTAKLAKYNAVRNALDKPKLIRNFAKITVINSCADFTLTGFWLTNVPDRGSFAPYNRNTGTFVDNYDKYPSVDDMRGNEGDVETTGGTKIEIGRDSGNNPIYLQQANYPGFYPAGTGLVTISGIEGVDKSGDDLIGTALGNKRINIASTAQTTGGVDYCYEREVPKSNPLYVIISGKYTGTGGSGKETYYKVDLKDQDDNYFPILRNFNYRINIKNVIANGSATVAAALEGAPSGNIDTNLDMLDLTNLSDGKAQIFVSETERILVNDDPIKLIYKYIPDVVNAPTVSANITKEQWEDANTGSIDDLHTNYVTVTRSNGGVFKTTGMTIADDDRTSDGYREITLSPLEPSSIIKTETITITGYYWIEISTGNWAKESISRTVTYRLRNKMTMNVSCTPTTVSKDTYGQNVDVIIGLEAGLPSSIFPLTMVIEPEKPTLAPRGSDMPVQTGWSSFDATKPAYQFTKTITWAEYLAMETVNDRKNFTCQFKTSKAVSATAIRVSNEYFYDGDTYFKNTGDPNSFMMMKFTKSPALGTSTITNFEFFMPTTADVKVTLTGATWNDGTEDKTTFTYTPTAVGKQTISNIKTSTYGDKVTVKLEATDYSNTGATTNKYRSVTIPAGNTVTGNFCPDGTNFGADSEGTKTSAGIISAGLNGTSTSIASIPVTVTRTGTKTKNAIYAPDFDDTKTLTITRSGDSGSRKYEYKFTIKDFSSYNYYYSTSETGTKTKINDKTNDIKNLNSRTLYIWAQDKATNEYSNYSTLTASFSSNETKNANVTIGETKPALYSYTYSVTGPSEATTIEFSQNVDDNDEIKLYYGSNTLATYKLGDLD